MVERPEWTGIGVESPITGTHYRVALLGLGLLVCAATPAIAHDFWIETDKVWTKESEAVTIATFRVGTAAEPEEWTLRRERIVALRSFGPNGIQDQQADIMPGKPARAILRLKGSGTHVVTLESAPTESDLPADEFNDYVEHEGLNEVRDWRAKNAQTGARGREVYARRAKALIQLGPRPTDTVSRPLGLSLEIVPERNPLMLRPNEALPLRLYFRGKPLASARFECESLDGLGPSTIGTSDANGRANCAIIRKGRWKVATVWSVPITGNPHAEFDTLFSSLTFGY